jgi:hypothetical protein
MVDRYTESVDWTDLDGRMGGEKTASAGWTEEADGSLHVFLPKVRVAGSNPAVRSL